MLKFNVSKSQAKFHCITAFTILFIILVAAHSGIHRKLSSTILNIWSPQSRTIQSPDQLLDVLDSPDGKSKLYRFAGGTVEVKEESTQPLTDQELTNMSQPLLATQYERQLLETSANCSKDRGLGITAASKAVRAESEHSLCMVGVFKPQKPCYSFSFSMNDTWKFEKELAASFGCMVMAFDPGMKQASHMNSERLMIFREGLNTSAASGAAAGSAPSDSFFGYLKHFKADTVTIDALKIVLGPRDWPALAAALHSGSLSRVKQLMLSIRASSAGAATASQLRSRISTLNSLHRLGFRRFFPLDITKMSRLDGATLNSYVNVNFLTNKISLARNPSGSKIEPPLEKFPITPGPHYKKLEKVRRANLSKMSAVQLESLYFSLVMQQHLQCHHSRRIGDAGDGGWDVCFSEPFNIAKSKPWCVAFSFGINYVWGYDDILAEGYHCRVHMFDPSMLKVNDHQRKRTSWFYRAGLSSNNSVTASGWKMRTLCRLFDELGYTNRTIDILKIDIEFWEWEAFETALKDGCLIRVKQLLFETHTAGMLRKPSDYARYIRVLMGIFNLGFRTWKWHMNVYSVFYKSDSKLTRACCYEHYLLNTRYMLPGAL